MIAGLAFALALSGGGLAQVQAQTQVPAACRPDARGEVDWQACHDASAEGSPARRFALINLGTEAYLDGDYGAAVRFYDLAESGGFEVRSDVVFHTFRADARNHVGRDKEALEDARLAWAILSGVPLDWMPDEERLPLTDGQRGELLTLILPILKAGSDPALGPALAAYRALPVTGWYDQALRASVLEQLGDFDGALAANAEAMKAQPGDPGLANNHCYILTRAGRAAQALPFCEQAVAALPDAAPIQHSLAATLAQLGRCEEAEAALAEAARLDPASALYRQPIACTAP